MTTEVGRQPWVVYEVMKTDQAVTDAGGMWVAFGIMCVVYAGLLGGAWWLLKRLSATPAMDEVLRMTLAVACMVIVLAGLAAYAVLAGADFGAGLWDLTAGGAERGGRVRGMVQRSMSPVWEANHVWLILVIVVLWTAFPTAFGSIFSTLYIPLFGGDHRDHLPGRGVRPARPGGHDRRGARPGRHVRAGLAAGALLPGHGAGRDRLGPGAGGQRRRRRVELVAEPDVADRRRAGRADRRLPGRRVHGRGLRTGGRARHGSGPSAPGRWAPACWPASWPSARCPCCPPTRPTSTTG